MPQITVGSTNISTFGWSAVVDIFNRKITFSVLPFTTGSGLINTKVSFSVVDQDGLVLASIDFTNAANYINSGVATTWVLDLSNSPFIFLFQAYTIIGAIQDQGGIVSQTTPVIATVCQPNNLQDGGYVPSDFCINQDCVNNFLTVKELTLFIYDNLQPVTPPTKTGTLNYPVGTLAAVPFTGTPFQNTPIYTGHYTISCTTVAQYAIGNDVYVNVTYMVTALPFEITCTNKIGSLLCCIQELQESKIKNCDNAIGQRSAQLLDEVQVSFFLGLGKDMFGMDSSREYEFIKKTLNCNCGNSSVNQNEPTPVNPSVYSILLQGVGGTTTPPATINGSTKTFPIQSNVYQVTKGSPGDPGFTVGQDSSVPNLVKYPITLNYLQIAQAIYNATANDPTTLTQLNNLTQAFGVNLQGLNGGCIIDLTDADYVITQAVTNSTGVASIVINGTVYPAPNGQMATDTAGLLTWLNSLSLGTFTVTLSNGILTIMSLDNSNSIATISFTNPSSTVQFQKTSATLVQIIQAIVNYICNLSAAQMALGSALALYTFDYNGNMVTTNYKTTDTQASFNQGISQSILNIINRIKTLTGFTCGVLQSIFNDNPSAVFNSGTDRYLAIVNGNCTTLTGKQQALAFLNEVNSDSDVKAAWCLINCSTPGTCPDITDINLGVVSNTIIGVYAVVFNLNPIASQSVIVKYRVTGTQTWITATTNLGIFANGNVMGISPYQIPGLLAGTMYDVWIQNNCGGNGRIKQITTPATSISSGSFLLDNSSYNICGDSPVTLYSSVPFAAGVRMYTDAGLTIPVTGFNFIASVSSGHVFTMSSTTGIVIADTGSLCSSGTAGTYGLANTAPATCSAAPQTLYTNGVFAVGGILYQDSALTTPVVGFSFVVQLATNHIFALNNATGQIGADTGTACSGNTVNMTSSMAGCQLTNVTGITGFTPSPAFPLNPGGNIVGIHSGFTGAIACTITGNPIINPSNISLYKNGVLMQCITVTGPGTFTFSSFSYLVTDLINISLNTGHC